MNHYDSYTVTDLETYFEQAKKVFESSSKILVSCHRKPDADALGSAIAAVSMFCVQGKETYLFLSEPIPGYLQFLFQDKTFQILDEESLGEQKFDSVWLMDAAAPELFPVGFPSKKCRGTFVVVDHHALHSEFGDVVMRDVHASSTGEVLANFFEWMGWNGRWPLSTARGVYAAIVADTGGFRYSQTKAATLRWGAKLVEQGVDPWEVAYALFEGWPKERLKLLGKLLDTIETHFDGKLAVMQVPKMMLEEVDATDDMLEGMVNYGRMLRGVEVSVLIWEPSQETSSDAPTKISFRSRGAVDVSTLAKQFGGGGHRNAAGASTKMSIEQVYTSILDVSRPLWNQ